MTTRHDDFYVLDMTSSSGSAFKLGLNVKLEGIYFSKFEFFYKSDSSEFEFVAFVKLPSDAIWFQSDHYGRRGILKSDRVEIVEIVDKKSDWVERFSKLTDKSVETLYASIVKEDWRSLPHVPKSFRTTEFYLALFTSSFGNCRIHSEIPEESKTSEFYLAAVTKNGGNLCAVPELFITPEMCLVAVNQAGTVLLYVPEKYRTSELYLAAVTQYGDALQNVPEKFHTSEMYLAAVIQSGYSIRYVPKVSRTQELYLAAVNQYPRLLIDHDIIPESALTHEMYLTMVKKTGSLIQSVPKDSRTPEIYLAAAAQNGKVIQFFPRSACTSEIYLTAVRQDRAAIKFVHKHSRKLCLEAVGTAIV